MLNKEVCRQCHNQFIEKRFSHPERKSYMNDMMYDFIAKEAEESRAMLRAEFDECWDDGKAICYPWRFPGSGRVKGPVIDNVIPVDGPVPHWCPYSVEHVVS